MKKYEKLIQEHFLNNEEAVIKRLKSVYNQSLKDIEGKARKLQKQIEQLDEVLEMTEDEAEREKILSQRRSKVYQKQYQEALKKQVSDILDTMHEKEFKTVSDYLDNCYEDGFVSAMYSLQQQDIPLMFPLDQTAMVRAVQLDSKISEGLYTRLGEDVSLLKRKITAQVSRGISTGMSFQQTAQQLAAYTKIGYNNAVRIARTEGHRIQVQSGMDACYKAKEKGADVVKQWDSTLDGRTRPEHRKCDGEIKELDESFSNGLMFPGDPDGGAREVVNCRCALLQRARWGLDDDELEELKKRAEYFGLDKTDSFEDFKNKYLEAAGQIQKQAFIQAKTIKQAEEYAKKLGVKYVDYSKLDLETANEFNKAILTLPDDVRPVFCGDSASLEKHWGAKLKRSSKNYYGVAIDTFDGIHLGMNKYDFDTNGYMVGISSHHNTAAKITKAKRRSQKLYQEKFDGQKWFFNENGEATLYHEMGHVYANTKGIPEGFARDAERWAKESGCAMLEKTTEAWAEAWGAFYTNNPDLPDYISKYIEEVSKHSTGSKLSLNKLTVFDDDGIMKAKIEDFTRKLSNGEIKTLISPQKQLRHVVGSKGYDDYAERLSKVGDKPAYIREDLDLTTLKQLVDDKLGTGTIEVRNDGSVQEFFDCDEIVGYYYDKATGKYVPTKRVQVKYSIGKGNIHIIPVKGKG